MAQANPRATIGDNQPPPLDVILADRYADLTKRQKAWKKKADAADLKPKTEADIAALEKLFADGDALVKEAAKEHTKEKEPFLRDGKVVDKFFNVGIRDAINPLAGTIKLAALSRRRELTLEEQRKANEKAAAEAKAAQELEDKAAAARARGEIKQAQVFENRADAKHDSADEHAAIANQDLRTASKTVVAGISSVVGTKLVCSAIVRKDLDLEALRPFLKEADLIAAVNALIKTGETKLSGAIITEEVTGSIRRR